jgi:ABC-type Zn uptake system ZnuABC Zn-binding protein ZnuA
MEPHAMNPHPHRLLRVLLALALALAQQSAPAQEPLRVVATVPDLGALAQEVGGAHVAVETLVRGPEDPHFTVARPSLVRTLAKAELLVVVGLDLEFAWLQPLCDNARNARILRTGDRYVDVSRAMALRGLQAERVDRSLGDVHRGGNPHFLSDPLCGLRAAEVLCERLSELRPQAKDDFAAAFAGFRRRLCEAMVGEELAADYGQDAATLARLFELDRLDELLAQNGDEGRLGGWFLAMRRLRGAKVVADHDLWPYFAARFGVEVRGFFEPRAGVAPTARHLQEVIERMQAEQIRAVISTPYFSPQHAAFVAEQTGARIAAFAHQVGARPGCDGYIETVGHNVRELCAALGEGR